MKKNFIKLMVMLTLVVFMSGCAAYHSGNMSNSASLGSANFMYVKPNIRGMANATYLLGIGGLQKNTLVDQAKQNMLVKSPLKDNQALANVTVNFKNSFYLGLIVTVRCTVTADVVEFK